MGLFDVYQDICFDSNDLLCWIPVDGDLDDSGPNGNDWQEIGSNNAYAGSYTTFQSGRVNCNITGDQFCAAFDIARTKGSGSPILHNYSGGSGEFIFGVMDSDLFYVGRPEDTGCGVYVFDQIACPSRSIVYLSKAANDFTLGYYDGEVGRTFSQTISLPAADTGVTGFNLQMGDAGLPGYQTNYFELHEAFIMAAKGQASGMNSLYNEIYSNSTDVRWFNRSLNVLGGSGLFYYEDVSGSGINRDNSNFIPSWSISPEGFSIRGSQSGDNPRFYVNGLLTGHSISSNIVDYTGSEPSHNCLYDSYFGVSYTGSAKIEVSGNNFTQVEVSPFGEIVYSTENTRLRPQDLDYISVADSNPIYLKNSAFFDKRGLLDIEVKGILNGSGFPYVFPLTLS